MPPDLRLNFHRFFNDFLILDGKTYATDQTLCRNCASQPSSLPQK